MIPAMHIQLEEARVCAAIVMVPDTLPIVEAIEAILLLGECSVPEDWMAGVIYLPLA